MLSHPLVSIGLPVYNGANYVRAALDSILASDLRDLEVIVSDNASTDETVAIVQRIAAKDRRVRLLRQAVNRGAAPNYNVLVDEARGKYFKWAAHDDAVEEAFLKSCLDALESAEDSTVLSFPRTRWIDSCGERIGDYGAGLPPVDADSALHRLEALLADDEHSHLHQCSPIFGLIRSTALRRTHRIQPFMSSDKVALVELALLGTWVEVPQYLFLRRVHQSTSLAQASSDAEVFKWFDTSSGESFPMPRTRLLRGYLRAVRTMPLSRGERLRCMAYLTRRFRREWRIVGGEHKIKLREWMRGRSTQAKVDRAWLGRALDAPLDDDREGSELRR